ncbi:uncharacterized protein [Rutidosis leptorrhynchoides]|uniref:uncharacterized protein n=1 Tax=Rutidosis leptorrhynchoides TaxID=125765 RepID=UPI003A9A364B
MMWLTNEGKVVDFSTKHVWEDLRNNRPVIPWHCVIWFTQANPKHAFIMWLVILNRLATQDRMQVWYPNQVYHCALCNGTRDSVDHIFFQCPYASTVWYKMKLLLLFKGLPNKFKVVIEKLMIYPSSKQIWNVVNRLMVAAVTDFLWQERNWRLFKHKSRTEDELCKVVTEYMRMKLLTLKVKHTQAVKKLESIWDLQWRNGKLHLK